MSSLLDLADASLSAKSKEEQLIADINNHQCRHVMYPPFFARKNELPALDWQQLPFTKESRDLLPREKGVYAFAVTFSADNLPPNSHIMYVGKAGDTNSSNTIWARYYNYLRTERINDRTRIGPMLRKWKGHITYYFATVEDGVSTGDIEKILLDIFVPPLNRGDYSAELSSLLKGANII